MQRDVAVRDARQRDDADDRGRALVQRSEVVVDLDRDLGLVVVRQLDVGDLADVLAGDLDLVAVDELAGVLEADVVLVPPPPPNIRTPTATTAAISEPMAAPRAIVTLSVPLS